MTWTELEDIIKDTIEKIRGANPYSWLLHFPMVTMDGEIVHGDLKGNPDDLKIAEKNVKALCDYMFADGKIDIDKDIRFIYDCAKKLSVDVRKYIDSDSDIKRVLYEDNKTELDNEPLSTKELAKELSRIEGGAENIARTIDNYFTRRGEPHPGQTKKPHPEPPNIESGEIQGSGKETPPEALKMENLPTIYDDEATKQREQRVFCKAIKNKWMKLNESGNGYIWDKTKGYNHLAYMCGRLYCDDKIDIGTDGVTYIYKSGGRLTVAAKLKELFGGVDVGQNRSEVLRPKQIKGDRLKNWRKIDILFKG